MNLIRIYIEQPNVFESAACLFTVTFFSFLNDILLFGTLSSNDKLNQDLSIFQGV